MDTSSITQASQRSNVDIPETVRRPRPTLHPHQPLSRKNRTAAALNISTAVADKLLYGERAINLLYAQVIESDLRAGDHDAVAQWIAPADAALSGSEVLSLMEAFTVYDAADVAEDAEQVALNRKCAEMMGEAELNAYAKSVAKELYAGTRCLAAIRAVQRERRMAR